MNKHTKPPYKPHCISIPNDLQLVVKGELLQPPKTPPDRSTLCHKERPTCPYDFHEIAETKHHILNPFTHQKLMLLGEICRLIPDMRLLDLCCGKAEMLCQWSKQWGISGIGVDISSVFLAAARDRIAAFNLADRISVVEADAGTYMADAQGFDVVSCIGATWIGDGLVGTLKLMQAALKAGGLLLVGEPYWITPPSTTALEVMQVPEDAYGSLLGTLDRIESIGLELVEMVLADGDSWDRYAAAQWWTINAWLRSNPDDPDASALREWAASRKRIYLEYQRAYMGWGVFVMRATHT